MTINPSQSLLASGLNGLKKGQQGIESAAKAINMPLSNNSATKKDSLIDAMIALKHYEAATEEAVELIQANDEFLGTLLDLTA